MYVPNASICNYLTWWDLKFFTNTICISQVSFLLSSLSAVMHAHWHSAWMTVGTGTNQTIARYFEFLANKIDAEWEAGIAAGRQAAIAGQKSVLEIACNDATQLDCFQKKQWKTFGVDPGKCKIQWHMFVTCLLSLVLCLSVCCV